MALILCLILGLLFLGYCASDKSKLRQRQNDYMKDHPPCKLQEEYLISCELYHQYLLEGRKDAYGDAIYDARRKIYE